MGVRNTGVIIDVGEALHVGAGHHVPQVFHRVGNRRVERHLLRIM